MRLFVIPMAAALALSLVTPAASAIAAPVPSAKKVDCKKAKCVALTMDDGPVAGTAQVLDTLKKYDVPATFFVVGKNAAARPKLLARMVREGHEVGSHSWDHAQLTKLSRAAMLKNLKRADKAIRKGTGKRVKLLRPPYGSNDANVKSVEKSMGYRQVLWTVDPLDWKYRNTKTVVRNVLKATRRNSIILTHDIHATTRAAYPKIIKSLKKKGYTFVTVSQLLRTR
ncbi:MAG: polysaccharide deacetylase family protein [Propionibacteriaceae bacterium]|nr:polysaccharide deacetylase family protein [Propionibacteriaceae bacterium]